MENTFWTIKQNYHIKFSKTFYDLSLHEKIKNILLLPEEALNRPANQDTLVLAIIQHSPDSSKKMYPARDAKCILGERKISKAAKDADLQYQQTRNAVETSR